MKEHNVFRVVVKTTNSIGDTTYGVTHGQFNSDYVTCMNGELYVFCETPSDVEKIVRPDMIKFIERIGVGYDADPEYPKQHSPDL